MFDFISASATTSFVNKFVYAFLSHITCREEKEVRTLFDEYILYKLITNKNSRALFPFTESARTFSIDCKVFHPHCQFMACM